MSRMDLADIMHELGRDTPLNRARKKFSSWCARIEQAGQQHAPLSPIELRRMEFEAVKEILAAGQEQGTL